MVPLQLLLAPCNRTLGGTADAAAVASHGYGLLLLADVLEELLGAGELPAIDGLGGLAGVLERNTEVRPAGASRLRRGDLSCSVPNLNMRETAVSLCSWEPTSTCVAMRAKFSSTSRRPSSKVVQMGFRGVVRVREHQFRRGHSPSCLVVDASMSTGCEVRGGRGDGRNFGAKDRFSRLGLCGQLGSARAQCGMSWCLRR